MRERLLTGTLVLLAVWAALGGVLDLFFRRYIFTLEQAPSGILAGRLFEGDQLILALLWLIAAFNPARFGLLIGLAALAQAVAIGSYVLHAFIGDLAWRAVWLPLTIAALFLIALLLLQLTPDAVVRMLQRLRNRSGSNGAA